MVDKSRALILDQVNNIDVKAQISSTFMPSGSVSIPSEKAKSISKDLLSNYTSTLFGGKFTVSILNGLATYRVELPDGRTASFAERKHNNKIETKDWAAGSRALKDLTNQLAMQKKQAGSNTVFMQNLSRKWQAMEANSSKGTTKPEQIRAPTASDTPPKKANALKQAFLGYQRTWAEMYLSAGQLLVEQGLGSYVGLDKKLLDKGRNNLDYNQYRAGANRYSKAYGMGQGLGDVTIPVFGGGVIIPLAAAVAPEAIVATGSAILTNPVMARAGIMATTAQIIDGLTKKDARKVTSGALSLISIERAVKLLKQARSIPEMLRLERNADILQKFANPDGKLLKESIAYVHKISKTGELDKLETVILEALVKGLEKNLHVKGAQEALATLKSRTAKTVPVTSVPVRVLKPTDLTVAKNTSVVHVPLTKLQLLSQIKQAKDSVTEQLKHILDQNPKADHRLLDANIAKLKVLKAEALGQGNIKKADQIDVFLTDVHKQRMRNPNIKLTANAAGSSVPTIKDVSYEPSWALETSENQKHPLIFSSTVVSAKEDLSTGDTVITGTPSYKSTEANGSKKLIVKMASLEDKALGRGDLTDTGHTGIHYSTGISVNPQIISKTPTAKIYNGIAIESITDGLFNALFELKIIDKVKRNIPAQFKGQTNAIIADMKSRTKIQTSYGVVPQGSEIYKAARALTQSGLGTLTRDVKDKNNWIYNPRSIMGNVESAPTHMQNFKELMQSDPVVAAELEHNLTEYVLFTANAELRKSQNLKSSKQKIRITVSPYTTKKILEVSIKGLDMLHKTYPSANAVEDLANFYRSLL